MTTLSELDAKAMGGEWLPLLLQDDPRILEYADLLFACELVNRYRTGQLVERQEGMVVPVEPTDEMLRAGWNAYLGDMKGGMERFAITYRAMLAAAQGRKP